MLCQALFFYPLPENVQRLLIQMPKIIKLVLSTESFSHLFFPATHEVFTTMLLCNCTISVKIAILFLCQTYLMDKGIKIGFKLWIGECLKGIACTFNYLVYIRIIERVDCLEFAGIEPAAISKFFTLPVDSQ